MIKVRNLWKTFKLSRKQKKEFGREHEGDEEREHDTAREQPADEGGEGAARGHAPFHHAHLARVRPAARGGG